MFLCNLITHFWAGNKLCFFFSRSWGGTGTNHAVIIRVYMCNVCRNIQNWCFWSFSRFLARFWWDGWPQKLQFPLDNCFRISWASKNEPKIEKMIRNINFEYFGTHYTYTHVLWPGGLSQFRLSSSKKKHSFGAAETANPISPTGCLLHKGRD